jgi:Protein of unknown function (DUF3054)
MRILRGFLIDVACVLVFVLIGRRNHGEGSAASGVLRTAAPFLMALVLGWVAARRQWALAETWRFGIPLWVGTVALGLVFRRVLFNDGTAAAFIIVAALFLGLVLVGWRAIAQRTFARPTPSPE